MTQRTMPNEYSCTVCGTVKTADQQHFCPRCGAKMEVIESQPDNESQLLESDATIRLSSPRKLHLKTSSSLSQSLPSAVQEAPQKKQTRYRTSRKNSTKSIFVKIGCGIGLVLIIAAILYGFMGQNNAPAEQGQVSKSKGQLDSLIRQARSIGVPTVFLQPALLQEQKLDRSYTPFVFLSHQSAVAYYQHLAYSYRSLSSQVTKIMTTVTEQFQTQAQQDMQSLQTALSVGSMQNIGNTQYFLQQFSQDQLLLSSAQLPSDYTAISTNARHTLQALSSMKSTYITLTSFHDALVKMANAQLDTTAMQTQYDNDVQLFNNATGADDFQNLDAQIDVQYQQILVTSIQTFPYISIIKLNELETQIHLLQSYGVGVTQYQQRLNADQLAVKHTQTVHDKLEFFQQVDGDIASLHDDLIRGNAHYLVKQFHLEVDSWAKKHPYRDVRDGHVYALDNGYMNAGIGAGLDSDLASTDTTTGFEMVVAETNNALFNLHLFETDYNDQTAYNQVHATDRQMLNHYHLMKKQVLVVSLAEQAMRVYQNGMLVNSYHVTTGRQELPSLPGVWSVLDRKSPIIFTAAEPKGSPYWFPDTPINYAILYHFGGYFVHDAPWRANFGPGTQFPHEDASGTTAYNFDGSHGCINLQESDAGWVYAHTDWNTSIVIY